ncbi:unnamed protein product [Leptidea sinapis]|uniref:Uncharacterized protein n=1 Tax=Leptidea sinapis TaxID=189913 RepID=A0A5E4PTC7_9NEOP|nr:unnamed protein product [Leptidea sinapis]
MKPKVSENLNPQLSAAAPEKDPKDTEENKDDEEQEKSTCCDRVPYASVGDALFSSLVVAPLVVSVWRGTWGLMEQHRALFPYAQIFAMGILIHVAFSFIKTRLFARSQNAWQHGAGHWLWERFVSKLYTYIFVLACIMHWRGGWGIFDGVVDAVIPNMDDPHSYISSSIFKESSCSTLFPGRARQKCVEALLV